MMFPMSSRFCLQTSLPFSGLCPRGMSEQGISVKTFRSVRLRSSLQAPAIQYSCSGDFIAVDHKGSSLESKFGSAEPSEREERKVSMQSKSEIRKSRGIRSWDL